MTRTTVTLQRTEERTLDSTPAGISIPGRPARTIGLLAAGMLCLAGLPGVALSQSLVRAEDPAGVADVVRELGFQARMDEQSDGDPSIRSSASGARFRMNFYGCGDDNEECTSIQFISGFDLTDGTTLEVVNDWNRRKRFASAFLDDENDPFIQMDVTMDGGVSRESFEATLWHWQSLVGAFRTHIRPAR